MLHDFFVLTIAILIHWQEKVTASKFWNNRRSLFWKHWHINIGTIIMDFWQRRLYVSIILPRLCFSTEILSSMVLLCSRAIPIDCSWLILSWHNYNPKKKRSQKGVHTIEKCTVSVWMILASHGLGILFKTWISGKERKCHCLSNIVILFTITEQIKSLLFNIFSEPWSLSRIC